MTDEGNLPKFKYHPNLYELDILEHFPGTCECCGEEGNLFYQGMYCEKNVDYVCLDCIASGKAAAKFNGAFNYDHELVDNPAAVDELMHRTPGYLSRQEHDWPACCNDFCAYLSPVGTKELEELDIADDLFGRWILRELGRRSGKSGKEWLAHRSPVPLPTLRRLQAYRRGQLASILKR